MSLRKGDQRRVNMKEVEQHLSTQGALQPSGEYPAVKKAVTLNQLMSKGRVLLMLNPAREGSCKIG